VNSLDEHAPGGPGSTIAIGVISLAVAMGIGRFAFTPLLPLMMRDGTIDAASGADWASANYLGYLIGAWTAPYFARSVLRSIRIALVGVVISTLLIAIVPADWRGAALRLAAGVFSAWVLVLASSWCLAQLARQSVPSLGAWIYTGVGIGIAVAGAVTWVGGRQDAWLLWLELGLFAAAATASVFALMRPYKSDSLAPVTKSRDGTGRRHLGLVLSYGAFGFGYIVPATFLPALARSQVENPLVFGLTWPLFGIASAISIAIAARALFASPRRRVWAGAQALMAMGTGLPVLNQALWTLAVSSILVGGTFMVTTMAGLQLARELTPDDSTPLLAQMTSAFAVGQIAGPVLVRAIHALAPAGSDPIAPVSILAVLCLATSAVWLWRGAPRRP
jgi:MFS family permease